ncbi:GAF domain-containing protein [Hoeflea sp. G2-23]|uniref:Blue-light-activated histidine kinase n=1 Tax=Hoeflea algicola TaxID=2983763 RepID=A0ABT3Z7Z7_9HYPH|nr:HWE histidine kinase domain-containing protein [Hoeflea algicola]MCY0147878.1 GAF domain-containing protein [Hoeflea algicola]
MTDRTANPRQQDQAADLTNCDREPIHILGKVQSFGALISVSSDWFVNHVSTNIGVFLDGVSAQDLIGRPLVDFIDGEAIHDIRTQLQLLGSPDAVQRLFAFRLTKSGKLFDLALHISGRSVIIEIEHHVQQDRNDYASYVRTMIDRIGKSESVEQLCHVAARQVRALTGFDRVMVYQFQPDDSGLVIAEALKPGMDSFKGLHYPASDIPKQARTLYKRNLLRIISAVDDEGWEIHPAVSPSGEPLDLSLSTTRAVSPIHLEYLRNMGVAASMSISILKRGELWGLFACHHTTPHTLPYDKRTAAELFGQMFSFVLDQMQGDIERAERQKGRALHDRLMMRLADGASIENNFDMIASSIKDVIAFDGAAGWIGGKYYSQGSTPTADEFPGLARFLNTTAAGAVFSTENLSKTYEPAADFIHQSAGMLVLPMSRAPRDYIVLFRGEVAKSVSWAGNPEKPVTLASPGGRLTPRKSFETWREIVRGYSAPWTLSEIYAAGILRETLLEVVLRISDASLKERAQAQERQELLISELNHRVRNILNLIRGLINQSKSHASSITDFTEVIGGRIHALARAHDQITRKNWNPASVHDLIALEVEAYLGEKIDRVRIEGADVLLDPGAFTTFALVTHELITNSVKYGALSDQRGVLTITTALETDGSFRLHWSETDGPPISNPPSRRGFGTTLIQKSIPFELKGTADVRFDPAGLNADFMIPAVYVSRIEPRTKEPALAAPKQSPDAKLHLDGDVLIVEDNMIIALDAEEFVKELGARAVHVVARIEDALAIAANAMLSFALLDVNLGLETSEPIAADLKNRSIPFAFATGYGDQASLTAKFPDAPVVQKPYSKADIAIALIELARR